jgi:hypothetical protein
MRCYQIAVLAIGRDGAMPPAPCLESVLAHEAHHPFAPTRTALLGQFRANAPTAIDLVRGFMYLANVGTQPLIGDLASARRSLFPGIIAAD